MKVMANRDSKQREVEEWQRWPPSWETQLTKESVWSVNLSHNTRNKHRQLHQEATENRADIHRNSLQNDSNKEWVAKSYQASVGMW